MIRFLDEPADLLPIAAREPALGAQLMDLAIVYHGDPLSAPIWLVCGGGGAPLGAVGTAGKNIIVLAEGMAPDAELSGFVRLLAGGDANGILCGPRFAAVLKKQRDFRPVLRPVLKCSHAAEAPVCGLPVSPPRRLEDCWGLLAAESEEFASSDKETWLLCVSRGIRRRQTTVLMVYDGDIPVSTASIRGRTENGGIIESVVTRPDHRGLGFASAIVAMLTDTLEAEERAAYIVSADDPSERLYEKLGFEYCGELWHFVKTGDGE